jgi:glycosyltransferase involved in cell wall biosynthesis
MIETPRHRSPRIALAHDWLCGYRGGEAVLERLALLAERLGTPAGLYVMFDDGRPLSSAVDRWRRAGLIHASTLNGVPLSARLRRWLLPRYPAAVDQLSRRLSADHGSAPIDLLISTSSAAIKGMGAPPGVPHLCYCHGPARYVWSQSVEYGGAGAGSRLRSAGLRWYGPKFRVWDRRTAANVTAFVANSAHTAAEIRRCYGRESEVVHPPVRTGFFTPDDTVQREGFWLVAGALEPYKRVDLAIAAAERAGARLVIAGDGSGRAALERTASSLVRFAGRVSDEELRRLYRTAGVLIFPQVEDFGITAVEAQACGLPVVARRAGGALDSVVEGVTGTFFDEATPEAVAAAVKRVPRESAGECRRNAERFGEGAFDARMEGAARGLLGPVLRSSFGPGRGADGG